VTGHIAVVPVKGLTESKRRLSGELSVENRKVLVKALLEDVLAALVRADIYSNILVISPDQDIADIAPLHGASFVKQNNLGLNSAVEQATRLASRERAQSQTIVLADIPLTEPRDFVELFKLGGNEPKVVMAPSLKGGTNIMTMSPPNAIAPAYGRWSYARHLRLAQRKQLRSYSMSNPRVSFDIDTVYDLTRLRRLDPERKTRSGKLAAEVTQTPTLARNSAHLRLQSSSTH